jgi:hypothetical protein
MKTYPNVCNNMHQSIANKGFSSAEKPFKSPLKALKLLKGL